MGQSYNLGYDVRRRGGLWINFDHLQMINVYQNLDTQALSFFASISKMAAATKTEPTSFGTSTCECAKWNSFFKNA